MFCTHRNHPILPEGVLRTRLTSVGMSIVLHLFSYECLPVLEMFVDVQRLVINGCMCQIGTARALPLRRVLPSRRAVPNSLTALFVQRLHQEACPSAFARYASCSFQYAEGQEDRNVRR